ncbi:LytTR family DNA-binding domain-containing protein [Salipaludibacillus sp. LMS25]|jgi:two-component system response regulator AgrA|uniref:LytR/AlgR family response regulator transcription factor n=1 Tax=Salipaludibacillus sp. LMS25 TaxID=2924031 RepID=UPI0020CFEB33|nr:LytTR family DNA-binding domain-containing protein [Salipaludibacillus sp. LMS25]UTR14980.1 LytTR family DNA-binding domain-containing protein [Salipaludibacillus sp. LMS25]
MNVIICENETHHREFLQSVISRYAMLYQPSINIVLSAANPEIVQDYIKKQRADCYFLDIELGSTITGMDLARLIRERDPIAQIIFISMHADKLKLTFKYKLAALDFIVKDEGRHKLAAEIQDALKAAFNKYRQLGHSNELAHIQIKIGERIINIRYDDIYYFETAAQEHKIVLYEASGVYEFYGKLKTFETIDKRFYRCHKSYLVNLNHIKDMNTKHRKLTMVNGRECLIAARKVKDLQSKIARFHSLAKHKVSLTH